MTENKFGKIINTSSIAGFIGNIGQANYSATKGAVAALTKTLAKELAVKASMLMQCRQDLSRRP